VFGDVGGRVGEFSGESGDYKRCDFGAEGGKGVKSCGYVMDAFVCASLELEVSLGCFQDPGGVGILSGHAAYSAV
jgi:hypothetical protein